MDGTVFAVDRFFRADLPLQGHIFGCTTPPQRKKKVFI
jgi:hypothetical protein